MMKLDNATTSTVPTALSTVTHLLLPSQHLATGTETPDRASTCDLRAGLE
jgi:hypothetical protein